MLAIVGLGAVGVLRIRSMSRALPGGPVVAPTLEPRSEVAHAPAVVPAAPQANAVTATTVSSAPAARAAPIPPKPVSIGSGALVAIDGVVVVNVAGGPPTVRPSGPRTPGPVRVVTGRVVDRQNRPVADAIVLVDKRLDVARGNVMADAGATTDSSGAFTIDRAPTGTALAIAFKRGEWSEPMVVQDAPTELQLVGHGSLAGTFTYGAHGESFTIWLQMHDKAFAMRTTTDGNGALAVASLPPGAYTLSAGLAQAFGGGQSRTLDREITITADHTTEIELAFAEGVTVAITAHAPVGANPTGIVYWVFRGAAPATAAAARERRASDHSPSMSSGGRGAASAVEFHDLDGGTYAACAAFFDVRSMDALDSPYGCTPFTIRPDDVARDVSIALIDTGS